MVNLNIVARAMNEYNTTYRHAVDGVIVHVDTWYHGRKRIRVTADGNIHIGRAVIRPKERALLRDILDACDDDIRPFVPMNSRSAAEQQACREYNPDV